MNTALHRRHFVWILGGMLLLGIGFVGCTRAPDPWKDAKTGQQRVLVTFPPLYCLTHAVAGDDAYVLCYLSSVGPHEYEFNPVDAVKAQGANLLIHNGLNLDDEFVKKIKARQKLDILSVGATLPKDMLQPLGDDDDDDEHDKKDKKDKDKHEKEEEHHHHGAVDPHIWLGPPQAMAISDAIAKKLGEIDLSHAEGYTKRAGELKEKLAKLHEEGKERFKHKKNKKVLTMHDSFGYFAKAFGLEVAGSIEPQPNVPPDHARLAKLAKLKNFFVITFEPQYPKKQAEMLRDYLKRNGLDVRLTEFDPLETAPLGPDGVNPAPTFYFEKMRENIDNLAKALP